MREHEHLLAISKQHTVDFTRYMIALTDIELELGQLGIGFQSISFSDFHQDRDAIYSFKSCDSVARSIQRKLSVISQWHGIEYVFVGRQPEENFEEDLGVLLHVTQRAMQNYDRDKYDERIVAVYALHDADTFIGEGLFLIDRANKRMQKLAHILLYHTPTDKVPRYLKGAVMVLRGEI
jgi:hypothetical protein